MVILFYTKEKNVKKECIKPMLNDEICKLRDKLNESIEKGKDYSDPRYCLASKTHAGHSDPSAVQL